MSYVGRTFWTNIVHHYEWDDTLKEKMLVSPDDMFLVIWDESYCRLVRLDDGHTFHMVRDDVALYCGRG